MAGVEGVEPSLTILETAELASCSTLLCAPVNPVLLDFVEEMRNYDFLRVKRGWGCFTKRGNTNGRVVPRTARLHKASTIPNKMVYAKMSLGIVAASCWEVWFWWTDRILVGDIRAEEINGFFYWGEVIFSTFHAGSFLVEILRVAFDFFVCIK